MNAGDWVIIVMTAGFIGLLVTGVVFNITESRQEKHLTLIQEVRYGIDRIPGAGRDAHYDRDWLQWQWRLAIGDDHLPPTPQPKHLFDENQTDTPPLGG